MNWIKLSEPELNGSSLKDFELALQNKEVGYTGSFVESFRQQISDYLNAPYIGLFSSGTASIHLALRLAEVKDDDEVICQSLTFAASANPILYLGGKPVFVGSEQSTWNMSPQYLEQALQDRLRKGKRVKAIVPVHLYGMPASMREIVEIAAHYQVPIIEDAAEALGSSINGVKCGTFGKNGVLSFNANKVITTGGGGALISKDKNDFERANFFALQAKDPAPHYQHSQLGYNYAFSNLNAVLGNSQFKQVQEKINRRKGNFDHYMKCLLEVRDIGFQEGKNGFESNRWLTSIVLPSHEICLSLKKELESKYIESRPVWKPMHIQPLYKGFPYYGDGLEETIFKRGLCLPSGSGLAQEEIYYVADTISSYLKKLAKR